MTHCRSHSTPACMASCLFRSMITQSAHRMVKRKSITCLSALAGEDSSEILDESSRLKKCNTIASLASSPPRISFDEDPVDEWGQFVDMDMGLCGYEREKRSRRVASKGRKMPLAFAPSRAA
mmetsp:Transcript_29759/g.60822  ORF Transcript_29759/g.60822 Transcript_29759/m.60822 type:complete len:122 (-) Transcript_29759:128-493(-)